MSLRFHNPRTWVREERLFPSTVPGLLKVGRHSVFIANPVIANPFYSNPQPANDFQASRRLKVPLDLVPSGICLGNCPGRVVTNIATTQQAGKGAGLPPGSFIGHGPETMQQQSQIFAGGNVQSSGGVGTNSNSTVSNGGGSGTCTNPANCIVNSISGFTP